MEFDIRIIRYLLELTTEEMGKELGVSRQTICNFESGRTKKIPKVYKMAIGYMIDHKYSQLQSERLNVIKAMIKDI